MSEELKTQFVSQDAAKETGRFAILKCTPNVLAWMGSGRFNTCENKLPDDAKIVRFYADHLYFCVVLASNEFAEVKQGEVIPTLPPPMIERLADIEHFDVNRNSVLVLRGITVPILGEELNKLRTQLDERLGPDSPSLIIGISSSLERDI